MHGKHENTLQHAGSQYQVLRCQQVLGLAEKAIIQTCMQTAHQCPSQTTSLYMLSLTSDPANEMIHCIAASHCQSKGITSFSRNKGYQKGCAKGVHALVGPTIYYAKQLAR